MILVFAFARCVNARHIAGLILAIHPDSAHGVVHRRKNFHRLHARINTQEFFVNVQNSFKFPVQRFARDMRHIQINRRLPVNSQFFLIHDAVNRARGNVTRY